MPEGPEIRRVADRLNAALAGARAERVRFGLPRLERFAAKLEGLRIESVSSRGKALLTRFEEGSVLYSHNQLYGRWYVTKPNRPPRTGRSLRVAIETETAWALLYSASEIDVLHESELDEHPFLARLGPDLLDRGTTPAKIRARLGDERFRGRALGGLLLDQGFLAGVGNYLRSEILFFAGVPPAARPRDLGDAALLRVAREARSLTRRSYRTGGTTEVAELAAAAKQAGEPRRTWRHAVFNRDGHPCRRCGTKIRKRAVASRRLYWCPSCQPAPHGR